MNNGKQIRKVYLFIVACLSTLLVACGDGEQMHGTASSVQFLDSTRALTVKSPDSALAYIDKVEKTKTIHEDTIHWARVLVYTQTYEMDKMKDDLLAIMDDPDLDKKSKLYLSALSNMAKLCVFTGELEDAIRYNMQGDSLSYIAQNGRMQAEFHYNMGLCVMQRDNVLGERYLVESIEMFEELDDSTTWQNAIQAKLYLCNCYVMEGRNKDAISIGEKMQYDIDSISAFRNINIYDQGGTVRASLCALMCIAYAGEGMSLDAGMAYAKCQQYNSSSPSMPLLLANCLVAMERYEEAIEKFEKICKESCAEGDTLDYKYADNLNSLKRCYYETGNLAKAFECANKEMDVRQGLFTTELKNSVTEWEIRYKMRENETKLRDATKNTRIVRLIVVLLVGLLAVAVIFIFMFVRYNRILNAKNKALALQINKDLTGKGQNKAREAKQKVKSDEEVVPENAIEQIHQFVEAMLNRKLYCDSAFDKDALMTELNLNKRLVSRYFETVMGKSYVKFLAVTRVEYAADQIRQFPNYTIEAIAADSGIASRATFYRLFSDHFGISPTDYRRQCMSFDENGK